MNNAIYDEILKMPVIDTHEHLNWNGDTQTTEPPDVLATYLIQYMSSDLKSAGLKPNDFAKVVDWSVDISERWKIAEPYWEFSRYTGYGRALDIAVHGIYGIDGINGRTIAELNEVFKANQKPGYYRHVLKDLCNIEVSLVDDWQWRFTSDSDLFKRSWQFTPLVIPTVDSIKDVVKNFERDHQISVNSLDDWLCGVEKELDLILSQHGTRFLKTALAYERSLKFDKTPYRAAKDEFQRALHSTELSEKSDRCAFSVELQNYMMHYILKLANDRNLTVQFHTGTLEGNGGVLTNSDPALLTNLFLEYPNVDFDLFHISYPYQNTASALCKMFPNVFIDMCWAHIISPTASINALEEFLDAVPYNKISAFGGDYCFADAVYGHLYIARQNVAAALSRKTFGEEKAVEIAKALFYDNPKRIFKL